MIATLQNSVKKMNDLLARLTRGNGGAPSPVRDTCLHPILSAIAGAKQRAHPVHLFGDPALSAKADPARLEQAPAHLLQNTYDATAPGKIGSALWRARGVEEGTVGVVGVMS